MDLALTYRALAEGQVDLIAGNSTDGLISRYGLVQLVDDRHYFPPYDAVPVVRKATLDKHPELDEVLRKLGGLLTVEEMRQLNYKVDGEKRQAKDVVREFLLQKGFISEKDLAQQKQK
jgi:glycine betaine/choline ABC-type transport system substrate-binding protein